MLFLGSLNFSSIQLRRFFRRHLFLMTRGSRPQMLQRRFLALKVIRSTRRVPHGPGAVIVMDRIWHRVWPFQNFFPIVNPLPFANLCYACYAMPHYTVRLDEAEIPSQWIHHFNVCHFGSFNPHGWSETPMFFPFVVSNSCCPRRRPEHHPGFGQHGQLQPKACWTLEPTIPSMPSMDGRWKIWVKPLTN